MTDTETIVTVLDSTEAFEKAREIRRKPVRDAVFRTIYDQAILGKEQAKFYIDYDIQIINEEKEIFECRQTKWLEELLSEKGYEWTLKRKPGKIIGYYYYYLIVFVLHEDDVVISEDEEVVLPEISTLALSIPPLQPQTPRNRKIREESTV